MTQFDSETEFLAGTHRICSPVTTWKRIRPLLNTMGVTRVADVTRLDVLDIPVWQAIRPASLNLSVSQGKGVTSEAARVSAAMESIEMWHAENLGYLPMKSATLAEMDAINSIPHEALYWRFGCRIIESAKLEWIEFRSLVSDRTGWLPRRMVELDFTIPDRLRLNLFHKNSNGLASGNNLEEGLVHALCELVERHALLLAGQRDSSSPSLILETVDSACCSDLIRRIRRAGLKVAVFDVTYDLGVPTFLARVVGPDLNKIWEGSGCHPNAEIALARALTEAAQSRLTFISGARDDLIHHVEMNRSDKFEAFEEVQQGSCWKEVRQGYVGSITEELEWLLGTLTREAFEPFFLDLTRQEIGLPVVRCFVPGLGMVLHG